MQDFVSKKARSEIFNIKPYVPGKPIEEVKRELGLDDIIKLASNENPLGPSLKAVKAIEETVGQIHLYPDSHCYYLKQKMATKMDVGMDNLLIGNGSDELLKLIAETFLGRGDEIIFAQPSFSEYEFVAKIMGATCIPVPLANFKHDVNAMLKAINPQTKMLFICNPNNPTGTILTESEMDELMKQVPDDILVIFDEAYFEYASDKEYGSGLKYVKEGRNAIVLRTFSKIYGLAALRIGYGITTEEIAQAVKKVTEPFNVNMLAQVASTAALDDADHVQKSCQVNEEGKRYLYQAFEEMGLRYVPTEANFIFFNTGRDCQEVFHALLKQGVIVRTGDIFGYPTYLRVTIGTKEENMRFMDGLRKVLA